MPDPNDDKSKGQDDQAGKGQGDQGQKNDRSDEIQALKNKNAELLSEKRKSEAKVKELSEKVSSTEGFEQKLTRVSEILGIDLKARDPEVLKREQEERQKAEQERHAAESRRTSTIERRVLVELAKSGKVLDDEVVEMLADQAKRSKVVEFDPETGEVKGIQDFLSKVLEKLGAGAGQGGDRKINPSIGKPDGKAGDGATPTGRFANVKTFQQLVEMGETARTEFERTYPALYTALRAANLTSARTPVHAVSFAPPQR